jgi:hypothetical protein
MEGARLNTWLQLATGEPHTEMYFPEIQEDTEWIRIRSNCRILFIVVLNLGILLPES